MAKVFDIAILGGTPAGLAAGYLLAKDGCSVVLVDCPTSGDESPLTDWAPARLFALKGMPKSLATKCSAAPFRSVRYHNVDFNKQAEHRGRSVLGYFLHPEKLRKALAVEARKAGVSLRKVKALPHVELQENGVVLSGTCRSKARILLFIGGSASAAGGHLSLPNGGTLPSQLSVAGLDIPLTAAMAGGITDKSLNIVETPKRSDLGMYFVADNTLHARVMSESAGKGPGVEELSGLIGGLRTAGLLPERLALGKADGAFWRPQAGVAMELNSHTAKRCLLAGSAGGFAAAVTGQTLYPSIHSALLAARCAAAVLAKDDENIQEHLAAFKTSWRKALGPYLCPPDASLQMLIPLLFANKRVVPRFTKSLLNGEKI
jgi:flavin-dependent dehydrogenase